MQSREGKGRGPSARGTAIALLLLSATGALASSDFADILFAPDVEIASRRLQTVEEAPSIVSVYSRQDIDQLGLRTVQDVLRITPGFTIVQDIDDVVVGSRGIVSDNNSKYVILINGHNVTSYLNLGINPNDSFPMTLENVQRVEVLKGPGSILWGSGALLGVINIVTHDGSSFEGTSLTGGLGNRDTVRASARHGRVLEGEGDFFVSAKMYRSDGTELGKLHFGREAVDADGDGIFETPSDDGNDLHQTGFSWEALATLNWKNLEVTLRGLELRDRDGLDNEENTWDQRSDFAEIAYSLEPVPALRIRGAAFVDYWRQKAQTRIVDEVIDFKESRFGGSFIADWSVAPRHRLILGGESKYTNFDDTSRVFTPTGRRFDAFEATEGDLFAQYDWSPVEWLGLTTAVRWTGSDRFDESIDPKAAVRLHLADDWTLKYIFQTAFLHPSAFQRNAFVRPAGVDNPEELERIQRTIENEEVTSHEAQVLWIPSEDLRLELTGFHSQLDDLITFNSNTQTETFKTFVNFGDVESWGCEVAASWRWWLLRHDASLAFARAELEEREFGLLTTADRDGSILGYPAWSGNFISRYVPGGGLSIATIVRVLGPTEYFPTAASRIDRVASETDPTALVDLTLRQENAGAAGLHISLSVVNLLDDDSAQPLSSNAGSVTPERLTAYGQVEYVF